MGLLNKFRNSKMTNLKDEILENLNDILNSKKEFASYNKDFGLNSHTFTSTDSQTALSIAEDIKTTIQKFEKRVQQLEVEHVPNGNQFFLSFLIKCKIENKPHAFQLSFQHQKNLFKVED